MNAFINRYDTTIQKLDDQLSALIDNGSDFDTEKNGDVLTISLEDGSKFIITPNSPVSQLWVSANYEGHRFNYDEIKAKWIDEKSGEEFAEYIAKLLSEKLNEKIKLML
jgi:iron donor protein CyaY